MNTTDTRKLELDAVKRMIDLGAGCICPELTDNVMPDPLTFVSQLKAKFERK